MGKEQSKAYACVTKGRNGFSIVSLFKTGLSCPQKTGLLIGLNHEVVMLHVGNDVFKLKLSRKMKTMHFIKKSCLVFLKSVSICEGENRKK